MSRHLGIRVSSSTSGSPAPGVEHLSGGYHYQRDPLWVPNDPRYRDATPSRATRLTRERAKRLTDFGLLRAQGLSIKEAGAEMGIRPKTAYGYERDWRAMQSQQREAAS